MHKDNFGYYISMIYRHMQVHLNKQFNKYGFGSGQYMFFIHIVEHEGITQKELSLDLAIDKGTTAKAIHKLSKLGYIRAKQNSDDLRSSNLYLTAKGKKLFPEVRRILDDMSDKLNSNMKVVEKNNSLKSLKKMAENITDKEE